MVALESFQTCTDEIDKANDCENSVRLLVSVVSRLWIVDWFSLKVLWSSESAKVRGDSRESNSSCKSGLSSSDMRRQQGRHGGGSHKVGLLALTIQATHQ